MVVGAPLLTAASVRFRRKTVLLVLMSWFAVGNLLSAVAPSFSLVMLGALRLRPAARRVLRRRRGRRRVARRSQARNSAMAVMFAGLTVANIVGVPLTTILGQHTGWRAVYAIVGLIGALAVAAIA